MARRVIGRSRIEGALVFREERGGRALAGATHASCGEGAERRAERQSAERAKQRSANKPEIHFRSCPNQTQHPPQRPATSQQECFPSPPAMCTLPRSEREPTRQGSRGSGGSARRQSRTSRASSSVYLCPLSVGAAVADLVPSSVASFRSTHPDRLATRSRSLSRTERRSTTTLPTST